MKRIGWITVVLVMTVVLLAQPAAAVELDIKGKSAVLMDVATGTVLFEKNAHEPLAQGYLVKPEDNWCATFSSAMAITCNLTDIVPTECGCERQVGLWQAISQWEEDDHYRPLPGDYIYYAWDDNWKFGDCTGWSDHVGIVVGTSGPFIKVIEGNKDDTVAYRIILRYHPEIRGYGLPDFASKTK